MKKSELAISKPSAYYFTDFMKKPVEHRNLFVLTHLGQLKQMEALIKSKDIKDNCLVVLYTFKNLVVPEIVHDQYSCIFDSVVFLEIPFGVNKADLAKLRRVEQDYKSLISSISPESLYLNSFEGHYAILISIAKSHSIKSILVEEGTATYKLNLNKVTQDNEEDLDLKFLRDKFIETVGQTQIFKKLVKTYKYNKDLFKQSKRFITEVSKDERVQKKLIKTFGNEHLKASLQPYKDFDQAYASFPGLIKSGFGIKDVDYFLVHEVVNEEAVKAAEVIIKKYNITSKDVLFVSQRYHLDSVLYVKSVADILNGMAHSYQTIFIKLHPKESEETYNLFKTVVDISGGRFVLIEDTQFLIESVIKVSKIRCLVGIASTTLIYAPLISPTTKSISIADKLVKLMESKKNNHKGVKNIQEHIEILKIFNSTEFV